MTSVSIVDDDVLVSAERAKKDPEVLDPEQPGAPRIESEAAADPLGSAAAAASASSEAAAAAPAPSGGGVQGSAEGPTSAKRSREDDQASCEDDRGQRKRQTIAGISEWRDALEADLQQRMAAATTTHEMEALLRSSDLHADFAHCTAVHSRATAVLKASMKQHEAAVMAKGKAICSDPQHFLTQSKIKAWTLLQKFYSSNKHLMSMQTCVDFDKRLEERVLAWKRVLKEYYENSAAKKEVLRAKKDEVVEELTAAEASDRCPVNLPKLKKKLTRLESKIERLEAAAGLCESNAFDVILNVFVSRKNFVIQVEGDFSARAEAWMQCLHRDVMNEVNIESCDESDADFDVESELTRLVDEDA